MNEYLKSQIEEHCQMVQRGAKPLSILPHQERYYDEIVDIIKEYKLHYSSEYLYQDWCTIYIYKNQTLKYLIPELPTNPKTPSEHALLGYVLGYDTESICYYILQNCKLKIKSINNQ